MLTIALMDEDVLMRLGLTILLNDHFKGIKILEADDLSHVIRAHTGNTPDIFVIGNYHSSKKKSIYTIQSIKEQFPHSNLIVYDYKRHKDITSAYVQLGVQGHLLRQSIGTEFIDCVKTVQNNQYYVCSDISGSILNSLFQFDGRPRMTARESVIAELLLQGKSVNWISEAFERSPAYINLIKRSILKKAQVSSVSELGKAMKTQASPTR